MGDLERKEAAAEAKKGEMLVALKERTDMIESLESLKIQADDENAKLQELLKECE